LRQRRIIFRLLLAQFWRMIASRPKADHRRPVILWRLTGETWLRRQGLICVGQNEKSDSQFSGELVS
jgi:hypothetical protein